MSNLKLTDHIGNKQTAVFVKCANNVLWYRTDFLGFDFAVPVADLGGAEVRASEPASMFMKWIKRQMEENAAAKAEQEAAK